MKLNKAFGGEPFRETRRARIVGCAEAVAGGLLVVVAYAASFEFPDQTVLLMVLALSGVFLVGDGVGTIVKPQPEEPAGRHWMPGKFQRSDGIGMRTAEGADTPFGPLKERGR